MKKTFYSNGKLLLTGEYAVLDGAKAWAIPTKFGQYLRVSETGTKTIVWKSLDENGDIWFEVEYELDTMTELSSSHTEYSEKLRTILMEAKKMKAKFLTNATGYYIETELTFPKEWGLGTSSTLINNIAKWANADPYQLLATTFGGSGYDIACAQHDKPILFTLIKGVPKVQELNYSTKLTQSLFFVYLNKKQRSGEAIKKYRALDIDSVKLSSTISTITDKLIAADTLEDFENLMMEHENVLSQYMKTPTIKSLLFADYPRAIKSLGAWGGDFILAAGDTSSMVYFRKKGYATIIPFRKMIL